LLYIGRLGGMDVEKFMRTATLANGGIGLGIALGALVGGFVLDDIPLGIATGLALGAGLAGAVVAWRG